MRKTLLYTSEKHGTTLQLKAFKQLLNNRLYIGEKEGNKDFCQPIIDRELFETVQVLISKNVKSIPRGTIYIFSGLIVCAECGQKMSGFHAKSRENKYPMYHCEKYVKTHQCTHKKNITERKLEAYLLENIKEEITLVISNYENSLKAQSQAKKNADKDKTKLKKKLDKMKELFVNDLITLQEYKEEHERYQALLAKTEVITEEPTINVEGLKKLLDSDFIAIYTGLEKEDKRSFWRGIIDKIMADNDGKYRIFFM